MIGPGGMLTAIKSVIGSLTDFVHVPFTFGVNTIIGYLQTGYYHIHGANFILPDENPITVTSGVGAWTLGTIVEVIGVGDVTKQFDIHWTSVSDISTTLQGMLYFYKRSDDADPWVLIGSACDVVRTTAQSREIQSPAMIPQQVANTAIGIAFKDDQSATSTCKVKLYGHVYSSTLT